MRKWEWVSNKLKKAEEIFNVNLKDLIEYSNKLDSIMLGLYGNKYKSFPYWSVMQDVEDNDLSYDYIEFYLMDVVRVIENRDYCIGCVVSDSDCSSCKVGVLYGWCVDDDSLVGKFVRMMKDKAWEFIDGDTEVIKAGGENEKNE